MKLFTLCLLAFSLTGCAAFEAPPMPQPQRDSVTIEMRLVDRIPGDSRIMGRAWYAGNKCRVEIEKAVYPNAITHEVMHCFSGAWHDDRPNDEWGYTPR